MSRTQTVKEPATRVPTAGMVDMKFEVVVLPVSDVDRAKRFYGGLGWRLDADFKNGDVHVVQMTPPGSQCSIHFGRGLTPAAPTPLQGLFLIVDDLDTARAELMANGVEVSERFHYDGIGGARVVGPDPQSRPYNAYATFNDPDGNGWLLQEVKNRLPGRGLDPNVAVLTQLFREAEERHGAYEPRAPKHHWSGWYAAYVTARTRGSTQEAAAKEANAHIEGGLAGRTRAEGAD
jgi:catechol 2,3-dioxygenase-like lactoylglutathione lyase family enzyme